MAKSQTGGGMPEGDEMSQLVARRRRKASIWQSLFALSTVIGIVMLALLLYNVINESFGYVATASTCLLYTSCKATPLIANESGSTVEAVAT